MRLAWIFCRTREDGAIPDVGVELDGSRVSLALPSDWIDNHPLTIADLEAEIQMLQPTGLQLELTRSSHVAT
jgi:exopolyphosphatase/guanosine-5'-triphosphate,3'-diphosphate pyrophosphatase